MTNYNPLTPHNPMKRPPFIFRLMLGTLFMPIMIALAVGWIMTLTFAPEPIWEDQSLTFGVRTVWIALALGSLPFFLWFWMLWSGNWRRPVLTAAIVYFSTFVAAAFELINNYHESVYVPPEKRIITLHGHGFGIDGAEIYCNGVLLGQTPLEITVEELIAKVPSWDSPPEQRWYNASEPSETLYTWVPWDGFLKERFEAAKELTKANNRHATGNAARIARARLEALNKHNADSRYWWSYRLGDAQMVFTRDENRPFRYSYNDSFDKQSGYSSYILGTPFSLSASFHAQLLIDILPELTPEQKADWDQYVLKHWSLLGDRLKGTLDLAAARHRERGRNDPLAKLYETALHSTARLKHGTSDPPTEEDARRLLEKWVAGSVSFEYPHPDRAFHFIGYDWRGFSIRQNTPSVIGNPLIPADLHEVMRNPLMEQWRKNKFRMEEGWAPVAYFAGQDKSPDYFAPFVRYTATTRSALAALLGNESPRAATLFKTLMNRRSNGEFLSRQIHLYSEQIERFSQVNSPLVEADFREYVVRALSDPKHTDSSRRNVERAVIAMIFGRIDREYLDKDEFAAWVGSLPIDASSKSLALRTLRIRQDGDQTFEDRLQQAAGRGVLIETELTLDDMTQWFADNPEGTLDQFLEEQEENISVSKLEDSNPYEFRRSFSYSSGIDSYDYAMEEHRVRQQQGWHGLPVCFVRTLLRSDTPEGDPQVRELIRRIWSADSGFFGHSYIHNVLTTEYVSADLRGQSRFFVTGSNNVPEYILDLILEHGSSVITVDLALILALCPSPKAGEILEQWMEAGESPVTQVERSLEFWRTRNALQQRRVEIFGELLAGRMSPDDLLLPQPPWVWQDGQYVQGE